MKNLFSLILLLISMNLFGQDYIMEIKLSKIKYMKDSVSYSEPKILSIYVDINKCSKIIELEPINNLIIGVQVEVLKSTLGFTEKYISGLAFYKKDENRKWERIIQSSHSIVELDKEDPMKWYKERGDLPPEVLKSMAKTSTIIKSNVGSGVHIEFSFEFKSKNNT